MLYYLHELMHMKFLGYITVRSGIGFSIAFILTVLVMPYFIRWAKAKKANQPINKYVEAHKGKKDTPTMGGLVFWGATIVAVAVVGNFYNIYVWGGLLTIILFGAIGLQDDLAKVLKANNLAGLTPKGKIALQILSALAVAGLLFGAGFNTDLYMPSYKYPVLTMGALAILFWAFVMVAASNAVNLTDGLDGLATMPSFFAFFSMSVYLYIIGNAQLSTYLLMPKIIGVGELVVLTATLGGALLGFLWYNSNPAEVFMGDSGSLTLGAFLGYVAILAKSEILLILVGLIFVIETVSVILQVWSFRTRGKRVFLMAPIHHHYEVKGWKENKIIVRFWIIALLANIAALILIKVR